MFTFFFRVQFLNQCSKKLMLPKHAGWVVVTICRETLALSTIRYQINKRTLWPESTSELYRPNYHHLLAKLLRTLWIEGVTWSVKRIPTAVFSPF
jgi:hypothetical protein